MPSASCDGSKSSFGSATATLPAGWHTCQYSHSRRRPCDHPDESDDECQQANDNRLPKRKIRGIVCAPLNVKRLCWEDAHGKSGKRITMPIAITPEMMTARRQRRPECFSRTSWLRVSFSSVVPCRIAYLAMRSTFQVRITCGWRGLSIYEILRRNLLSFGEQFSLSDGRCISIVDV